MYDRYPMRRTSIYLSDEELEALRLLGQREGRPVAKLVREAVDSWLEQHGVRVVDDDEWTARFDRLWGRRKGIVDATGWTADEVERDVVRAVAEVRRAWAAGRH